MVGLMAVGFASRAPCVQLGRRTVKKKRRRKSGGATRRGGNIAVG